MSFTTSLRTACALGATALLLASPARATPFTEVVWDARGAFEQRHRLAAGERYELCTKLARGTEVKSRFSAGGPVDFNVHHHQGAEVIYSVERGQVTEFQHKLRAGLDQTYCWMWTNGGADSVALKVTLNRR